ncbi:hypothetical protein IAT38_003528 [Cryptococcus sp. DSM 104549]
MRLTSVLKASGSVLSSDPKASFLSLSAALKLPHHEQPTCVVIREVPRTASPSDVLQAMRDSGAVNSSFPLSAITTPPPSLPRFPALSKSVHVTTDTPEECLHICKHIEDHPLSFSAPSVRLRPRHIQIHRLLRTKITTYKAEEWLQTFIDAANGFASDRSTHPPADPTFTAKWCMEPGFSGRRVVIKGLPKGCDEEQVRKLAGKCGLLEGSDGVKRLITWKSSHVSTYCLTVSSVSEAQRLVRKLHMRHYKPHNFGDTYLMRVNVVY